MAEIEAAPTIPKTLTKLYNTAPTIKQPNALQFTPNGTLLILDKVDQPTKERSHVRQTRTADFDRAGMAGAPPFVFAQEEDGPSGPAAKSPRQPVHAELRIILAGRDGSPDAFFTGLKDSSHAQKTIRTRARRWTAVCSTT